MLSVLLLGIVVLFNPLLGFAIAPCAPQRQPTMMAAVLNPEFGKAQIFVGIDAQPHLRGQLGMVLIQAIQLHHRLFRSGMCRHHVVLGKLTHVAAHQVGLAGSHAQHRGFAGGVIVVHSCLNHHA